MRSYGRTLALVLAIGMLVAAVPMAVAASHDGDGDARRSGDARPSADDGRARGEDAKLRHAELVEAKRATVEAYKAARADLIEDYRAELKDIRAWYMGEKKLVIEGCRAHDDETATDADAAPDTTDASNATNSTDESAAPSNETATDESHGNETAENDREAREKVSKEDRLAFAHCVRDGLKPLKEEAREKIGDARDNAKMGLKAMILEHVKKFRSDKANVDAKYGRSHRAADASDAEGA